MKTYDLTNLAVTRGRSAAPKNGLIAAALAMLGAQANATYGYLGGYQGGTNNGIPNTPAALNVAEIELDFAAIALLRTAAGQTAFAAADILQLFSVPAGTWVPATFIEILTVEGETATVDLGDGTDTDGFINDFDANAVAWGSSLITTAFSLATAGGKVYSAADTIDLLLNTAAFNVGKLRVIVPMVDLRAQR